MSADTVIRVEGLGKSYLVGHESARGVHTSFREVATRGLRNLARRTADLLRGRAFVEGDDIEEFWALQDVNFEVARGEVLGVIGPNGSGKSTLLKLLSRVTEPTRGRIELKGRVASLLEVGTGFHPELTGRENIFLNGAILGMTRREIVSRFDAIVDFAETEKFLDTPVKRYSSGMYVRLAFAVAAHLEPDVLVIDEVLAVGDLVFQKKCMGKMQGVANSGRTVLFVSHNMQTISALTQRCVLLDAGRLVATGRTQDVVSRYLSESTRGGGVYVAAPAGGPTIVRVELRTSEAGNIQRHGAPMEVEVTITTPHPVPNAALSFQIFNPSHQPVVHVLNLDSEVAMLREAGTYRLTCRFSRVRLYPGSYFLTFYFGASHPRRIFEAPAQICQFEVALLGESRDFYWAPDTAVYIEDTHWSVDNLAEVAA
ncbi:MAG TPA: polysaccharide ABC transporter ATP-binding protein [Usitatibacter sp.]|nr:polysaccharide ABC transporter ATP-binding protein [Usitatibacter sp.]